MRWFILRQILPYPRLSSNLLCGQVWLIFLPHLLNAGIISHHIWVFSLFFSCFKLIMISPVPLIEGVIHYPFSLFYTLVKTWLNSCIRVSSWVLFSVPLRVFLFLYQYHTDTLSHSCFACSFQYFSQ